MRLPSGSFIALGIWSAAAAACSAHSPEQGAHEKRMIIAQPNAVTSVRPGEQAEIRLEAQLGTGYAWSPKEGAELVKPGNPPAPEPGAVGGREIQHFLFQPQRKGTYHLTFVYEQPWAGGAKAARTERFTFEVR